MWSLRHVRKALPLLLSFTALAGTPNLEIKVDQAGYLPAAAKLALVVAKSATGDFSVKSATGDAIAFRGKLSGAADDPDSGDRVQVADFSTLKKPGKYYVEVAGAGRSWNFTIADTAYARPYYLSMRSYYGQRCGTAVDLGPEFPGFEHDACHLQGAMHASSGKAGPHVSKGGWHDAGDYGRYVVNSGISTGTLLWAWEMFQPKAKLNLPESGNGTPDILNEIKWNLDWMLTMQDEDGGVWHKQTSGRFSGFIMPEKDSLVSYVIGTGQDPYKSSCAAGDFAAVMAAASRAFRPFNAAFAEQCLRSARRAYSWLEQHPNVLFRNPAGVGTGAYGDSNCADEYLWAAAELWRATGDKPYEDYFLQHYAAFRPQIRALGPQSWGSVSNLALWSYVLGGGRNSEAVSQIRQDSLSAAQQIADRTASAGYHHSMSARDYIWGSNAVAANYGMQLLVAHAMQKNPRFLEAALDDLHYLLGRNPFSVSWVTQVGENPFLHPHHRPSGADSSAAPWPGLLSGGPNRNKQQDPAMRKLPEGVPPARSWVDEQEAYSANEVAINWNAPLVFLLAGVARQ